MWKACLPGASFEQVVPKRAWEMKLSQVNRPVVVPPRVAVNSCTIQARSLIFIKEQSGMLVAGSFWHPQLQAFIFNLEYKLRGCLHLTLSHPVKAVQKWILGKTQPLFHCLL